MQILHPFEGSVHQYAAAIADVDRSRPDHCPQCAAAQPLRGHGCYCRTLVDRDFDGVIREQPTRLRILRGESPRSANCL